MHLPSRTSTTFMAMALPNNSGPPSRVMLPATSQKLLRIRPEMWQKAQGVNPALKFLRSQSVCVSSGCARTRQIHRGPTLDRLGSDLFEARTKVLRVSFSVWHQGVGGGSLSTVGCELRPPSIELVLTHTMESWSNWDLEDLKGQVNRLSSSSHHLGHPWAVFGVLVWECPARGVPVPWWVY